MISQVGFINQTLEKHLSYLIDSELSRKGLEYITYIYGVFWVW